MDREQVLSKIQEIFQDLFDDENLKVNYSTASTDLDGWDSLMQMNLIETIEDEYNIRFSIKETVEMNSINNIIDIIMKKI